MKSLMKWSIPVVVLVALLTIAAMPAFAQGPTPTPTTVPTPTGKTVGDSLPLSCDWTYMPPAPAPGFYSDLFYRVPYAKSTQLVIYVSALPKPTDPNSFKFEVYTPYGSSLRYLFDERTITTWDNWVGDPAGASTPNKFELGDLSWSGMLNAGQADGYYTVDVLNFNTTALWFNLCSRNYINIR